MSPSHPTIAMYCPLMQKQVHLWTRISHMRLLSSAPWKHGVVYLYFSNQNSGCYDQQNQPGNDVIISKMNDNKQKVKEGHKWNILQHESSIQDCIWHNIYLLSCQYWLHLLLALCTKLWPICHEEMIQNKGVIKIIKAKSSMT